MSQRCLVPGLTRKLTYPPACHLSYSGMYVLRHVTYLVTWVCECWDAVHVTHDLPR